MGCSCHHTSCPYGDTHVAWANGGLCPKANEILSPTTREKPNPSNGHVSEPDVGPAQWNLDATATVADISAAAS